MKEFFNLAARPEIDTIRLRFRLDLERCRFEDWVAHELLHQICILEAAKDYDGNFIYLDGGYKKLERQWSKERLDFRFSSFSKMQIFEEYVKCEFKRIGWVDYYPVLVIEYSLPKYYKFSNGINRGVSAEVGGVVDFLNPCFEALESLNFFKYCNMSKEESIEMLVKGFEIRRLDLSFNFSVPDVKTALIHLSSCRLPKQTAKLKANDENIDSENEAFDSPRSEGDFSSVTFGGGKGSAYKIIFYDKALEQKNLFSTFERDLSYSSRKEKKEWYKKNKILFENIVRFEVQFHKRFFVYHIPESKYKKGVSMAEKIINLCSGYWTILLKRFDAQLNTLNHHTDEEYSAIESCLDRLEELNILGDLSNTQFATLSQFVQKCHKFGFVKVQKTMSKSLFSQYYNKVKKLTGFDIKVMCLKELPIMRIMKNSPSWLERGFESLYFDIPDYSQRERVSAC